MYKITVVADKGVRWSNRQSMGEPQKSMAVQLRAPRSESGGHVKCKETDIDYRYGVCYRVRVVRKMAVPTYLLTVARSEKTI